jgi:hypothetical protein
VMLRDEALALGRYRRDPSRWDTDFGRWVADYGVPRIVSALARDPDLRVTNHAVYHWLKGFAPRPDRAFALVELSGGQISLEAIYRHCQQVRHPAEDRGDR